MQPLIVDVEGRVLRFDGATPVRIGRSADAEVVLAAGSVSRVHAELRPVGDGWVLVDSGSQFGTFVDGMRVSERPITGTTEIRCGAGAPGSRLTVRLGDGALADGPLGAGGTVADFAPPPPRVDDSPTAYVEPRPAAAAPPPPPAAPPPPPGPPPAGPPPSGPPPSGPPPMAPPAASRFAPPDSARPAPGPDGPPPSVPLTGTVVRPPEPGGSDRPSGLQAAPAPPPSSADGFEQTQVLAGSPLAGPPGAPPMPPTGPDLMIVAEGTEHRFRHPAQISIGRRPDCTVVLTDPATSRLHGHVAATRTGWSYTNASNEGTFDDGKRVTSLEFDEATTLRLGHPVAGPELRLVPILAAQVEERRIARKRLRRRLVVIGAAAAAVLLVLGLVTVFLVTGNDDEPVAGPTGGDGSSEGGGSSMDELTDDELSAAKSATVQILVETRLEDGRPVRYSGSGSIIDSSGLILTNAHVAAPSADGLEELYGDELPIVDPEFMLISLTGDDDTPAEPEYRARLVEADGSMDAAVIEIFATADGGELEDDLELPSRPLGDSDEIDTGDDLTVLGFPGVSQSKALTVTTGVVATFIDGPFGPRSLIDTDARIAPGNSGGMAIDNDANIVGIPTAVAFDQTTPIASGRIRPINVVADLIERAEEQTG